MKNECCHQHPDNGSDLALQTESQKAETDLRAVNAKLIQCLGRIAGALDVPAASQLANVKELARMAIEEVERGR